MGTHAPEPSEQALIEQVLAAADAGRALQIRGGGTKDFYGNAPRLAPVTPASSDAKDLGQASALKSQSSSSRQPLERLDCRSHSGVIDYQPSELAIRVRAGTPLAEVESLLAENGQELPFEPPHFGAGATIGGMVASGLSGPRRPYAGAVRDAVLGVRLLNGQGQVLNFGGQVMKNVAGYDVSRLMAGALGILGVLLEVSLKVTPRPVGRMTLVHEQGLVEALARLRRLSRRALPITATAWSQGRLYIRIAGSEEALAESHRLIGGVPTTEADAFWTDLREQRLGPLDAHRGARLGLWRLSLPPATPAEALQPLLNSEQTDPDQLVEWGGAQRWLRSGLEPDRIQTLARELGGHATLFRQPFMAGDPGATALVTPASGVFSPLDPVLMRFHRNLKQAFDLKGIFNPGRLYPDL